jgi:hypothetical protein
VVRRSGDRYVGVLEAENAQLLLQSGGGGGGGGGSGGGGGGSGVVTSPLGARSPVAGKKWSPAKQRRENGDGDADGDGDDDAGAPAAAVAAASSSSFFVELDMECQSLRRRVKEQDATVAALKATFAVLLSRLAASEEEVKALGRENQARAA